MMGAISRLLLLLFLICLPSHVSAQNALLLDKNYNSSNVLNLILQYSDVAEDPSTQLGIHAVSQHDFSRQFIPFTKVDSGVQFTNSAFWIRTHLDNRSQQDTWYLSLWGSLSQQWEVYLRSEHSQTFTHPQHVEHFRGLTYQLQLEPNTRYELYLRLRETYAPINFAVDLSTPQQILNRDLQEIPLFVFAIGGLLTLALYNLIYFMSLRDYKFLALSVSIFAFTFELCNHLGMLHYIDFFWRTLNYQGSFFAFVAMVGGFSFLTNLFQIQTYLPRVYHVLQVLLGIMALITPFSFFIPYSLAIVITASLVFLGIIIPSLGVIKYRYNVQTPLIQQVAQGFFILALLPNLIRGLGIIDIPYIFTELTFLPLLICLTLLSLVQTEQIRIEREQAERVAVTNKTKDEFLTTMSHELRTPMNAVVNAGHLLKLTTLSGKQRDYVDKLEISSRHMLELINDILDLARADSSQLRLEAIPFQLPEVIHQTSELLHEQARKKRLLLKIENANSIPESLDLIGDPTRLKQVLLNLVGNAIKFTHKGKVTLRIQQIIHEENSIQLKFSVIDTGIGISPEQQKRLFKPFSQADSSTNRQYGGSGLGLAISHKLVERMGGILQLRSKLNQGSVFYFSLEFPLQPRVAEVVKPQFNKLGKKPHYPRILLVDDDALNRFFSQQLLENIGASVILAESGMEALEQLQSQPEQVELILMDVSMPEMDGYETTQRIRKQQHFQQLPIIALTAHAIAGEEQRCLNAGMSDYMTKPFEVELLIEKLLYWSQHHHQDKIQIG